MGARSWGTGAGDGRAEPLFFSEAAGGRGRALYMRYDGNYGLIEAT